MRFKFLLAALIWAAGMLVVMCTSDAQAFVYDQTLNYNLNLAPHYIELFRVSDIDLTDSFYLLQKTGHIISFGILYSLVFNSLRNHYKAFIICVLFAFSSEMLQLFFERNGRFFDVGVDFIGIVIAFLILKRFRTE